MRVRAKRAHDRRRPGSPGACRRALRHEALGEPASRAALNSCRGQRLVLVLDVALSPCELGQAGLAVAHRSARVARAAAARGAAARARWLTSPISPRSSACDAPRPPLASARAAGRARATPRRGLSPADPRPGAARPASRRSCPTRGARAARRPAVAPRATICGSSIQQEVDAGQVAVADLDAQARLAWAGVGRVERDRLALLDLAEQPASVAELQAHELSLPEVAAARGRPGSPGGRTRAAG